MKRSPHFLSPLRGRAGHGLGLYVTESGTAIATVIEAAFDSSTRKRGLLGRTGLPPGHALVIAPCNLIHTFRMAFDIDVVFVSREGRIVKLRRRLKPGRISGAFGAFATVEMAAGSIDRTELAVGQVVVVR